MARLLKSLENLTDTQPIVLLWLLRILVPLGCHRSFIENDGFENYSIAVKIGLGYLIDPEQFSAPDYLPLRKKSGKTKRSNAQFNASAALTDLRLIHERVEELHSDAKVPEVLSTNVMRLSQLVGLSQVDCRIIEFAVMIKIDHLLDTVGDLLGRVTTDELYRYLANILDIDVSDVQKSLSEKGALARSGLVSLDRGDFNSLSGKLDLLSDVFADLMMSQAIEPIELLKGIVAPAGPGTLSLSDYSHIQPTIDVLVPYLRKAIKNKSTGVNIFVYGPPGTGKSQLARTVAAALHCELFEVTSEDADGDAVDGVQRLKAFRAAQSFFTNRDSMIVFDEVEDVFNDGDNFFGRKSTAQVRKAWINRMLEQNPVPTLWLSNSVHCLDRAFVRRFDMIFELPVPPKAQRELILKKQCGDLLDAETISRVAEADSIAPAVVSRTASVIRSISSELNQKQTSSAFERLISNTLEAQGHAPLRKHDPSSLPEVYDPMFIHSNVDLAAVAAGLVESRCGRLCLYGPPGTGKTAYGRWLAQRLSVPLLVKRASDLMSPYIGQSEQNVAQAFRDATQDNAVLLIDEVDSFLQDRRGVQRSWEISLVNEMLTQMESYPGVFIASTNLMDDLDSAALRRFDLKVKFDFLRHEQAWDLLLRHCQAMGLPAPEGTLFRQMAQMDKLTPGDFATVTRQHRFRPIHSPTAFVAALQDECSVKGGGIKVMGFY